MKTQIVQLERYDDVVSIKDKMGWMQTTRILLILPKRAKILRRKLDLLLLKRYSETLGAQIALVTDDRRIITSAIEARIPVFKQIPEAQKARWGSFYRLSTDNTTKIRRKPEIYFAARSKRLALYNWFVHNRKKKWFNRKIPRFGFFTLGVIAQLAIAGIFVPRAEIILNPQTEIQQMPIEVQTDPDINTFTLSGKVPLRTIHVVVEGRESKATSGKISVPFKKAVGRVIFSNLSEESHFIPKGLILSTGQETRIRFVTTDSGWIPSGIGQKISLPIEAAKPGIQGNLPTGSIDAIEDPLGLYLSVINSSQTVGGIEKQSNAPNQKDYQDLNASLSTALLATAVDEIYRTINRKDILILDSLQLVQTLEETYEPVVPQDAEFLNLSLRIEFQGEYIRYSDLEEMAKSILDINLTGKLQPLQGSLSLTQLTEPHLDKKSVQTWKMIATRKVRTAVDISSVISKILSLRVNDAQTQILNHFSLATKPQIILAPVWWPRLPAIPYQIKLTVVE